MTSSKVAPGFFSNSSKTIPALSYAGATDNLGNVGMAMSVSPTMLDDKGSAITSCVTTPVLPAGIAIAPSSCVINGNPSAPFAPTTYSVVATNANGSSTPATITLAACPTHYSIVPANSNLGVSTFCVAQFEMKLISSVATSQPALTPWVNITQANAKTACTALGANYDLISNPEWMTIAYEIEKTASNWSSGVVGVGMLNRGHSDDNPSSALAVANTNDPYIGTGNNSGQAAGSGWEQKRAHTLSNGQVLWDFAGNVIEWTDWSLGGGLISGPNSCTGVWTELPDVSCGELSAAEYLPANPAGVTGANYNSTYGLGQLIGGSGAALRGGAWSYGTFSGAFSLSLAYTPSDINTDFGFRCVYRP